MSQENVERMRATIEAFNTREVDSLKALLSADAVITPVRSAVDGTVYRGADAAAEYCAAVEDSWSHLRWEIEDVRADANWVLALGHIRGGGRDTGAQIDASGGWLAHFREGRIVEFQTFSDRAEALKAVGLEE